MSCADKARYFIELFLLKQGFMKDVFLEVCFEKSVLMGLVMVGETGFEPATPGTQNQCSTKLSYSPSQEAAILMIFAFDASFFS